MTEEASAFIVSARAGIGLVRSAGFQTCRIADFQVGMAWNSTAGLILTAIRRFGNPRYSRFGNLRYALCTWKSRGPGITDCASGRIGSWGWGKQGQDWSRRSRRWSRRD